MILDFIAPVMTELVGKKEIQIHNALNDFWPDWDWKFRDAAKRCQIVVDPRTKIETLYADGVPILEMHPWEFSEPKLVGDKYVQTITQNFRRLPVRTSDDA